MFRLFSKLFSKKSVPQEAQEVEETKKAAQAPTPPTIPFKDRIKGFIINAVSKIRFWFYLLLCIASVFALGISLYQYTQEVTRTSINSAQAVMINVITDQVFIGSLYKDPTKPKREPTSTLTDKEVYDNIASTTHIDPEAEAKADHESKHEDDPNHESEHAKDEPRHEDDSKHEPELKAEVKDAGPTNAQKQRIKPICEELEKKARISIIITGLGLSKNHTSEVLKTEHAITLGFSPYARDVGEWVNQATKNGYEVMLNLPMQPLNYQVNDPGIYAMLQNLSANDNLDRLNNLISKSNKIVGFYSQPNEIFSSSKDDIAPIIERLSEEKFLFLYSGIQNQSAMRSLCSQNMLECLYVNYFAHDEVSEEKIYKQLQLLEAEALKVGHSIGYLNGYPVTLKVMNKWLSAIDTSKIKLVPLSNILACPLNSKPTDIAKDGKN